MGTQAAPRILPVYRMRLTSDSAGTTLETRLIVELEPSVRVEVTLGRTDMRTVATSTGAASVEFDFDVPLRVYLVGNKAETILYAHSPSPALTRSVTACLRLNSRGRRLLAMLTALSLGEEQPENRSAPTRHSQPG